MTSANQRPGDHLIDVIDRESADESAANDLLRECQSGYPVENLRRLLTSHHEAAVRCAAWIVSELDQAALPLLPEIALLLRHPSRHVRFFALDAVLLLASAADGELIASAIGLINDPDEAVRWKCMQFLRRATTIQLRAAVPHLLDIALARRVKWLLETIEKNAASEILLSLGDQDSMMRLFAAAAAARLAPRSVAPLEHAAASPDPEVASFARDVLE